MRGSSGEQIEQGNKQHAFVMEFITEVNVDLERFRVGAADDADLLKAGSAGKSEFS